MSTQPRIPLTIVVAVSPNNGIGAGGTLPWRLPREMAYFKHVTSAAPAGSKNAVVMGRNTWDSIPTRFRPLAGRLNVVISRSATAEELGIDKAKDALLFTSPSAALHHLRTRHQDPSSETLSRIFLIGGAQLYTQALNTAARVEAVDDWDLDRLLITRIKHPYPQCDVHLPEFRTPEQIEDEAPPSAEVASSGRTLIKDAPSQMVWQRSSLHDLQQYVGGDFAEAHSLGEEQEEKGTRYEFQMWTRVNQ